MSGEQGRAASVGDAQHATQRVGARPAFVVLRAWMQDFKAHAVPVPSLPGLPGLPSLLLDAIGCVLRSVFGAPACSQAALVHGAVRSQLMQLVFSLK